MGKAEWSTIFILLLVVALLMGINNKNYYRVCMKTTQHNMNTVESLTNEYAYKTLGKSSNYDIEKNNYKYKLYYDYKGIKKDFTDDYIFFNEELSANQSFIKLTKLDNINLDMKKELIQYVTVKDGLMNTTKGDLFISRNNIWNKEINIKDFYNHNFILKDGLNYLSFEIVKYDNSKQNNNPQAETMIKNTGDGYRLWGMNFLIDRDTLTIEKLKTESDVKTKTNSDESIEITYKDKTIHKLDKINNKIFMNRQPYMLKINHYAPIGHSYRVRQLAFMYNRKVLDRFVEKVYSMDMSKPLDLSEAPRGIIEGKEK